jgi:hypothetical protein
MIRKLFSEPLFQFVLIGAALFILYQSVSPAANSGKEIVVTEQTEAALVARFSAVWLRPPTATEINALIDSYVREEILYREGVTLGLDRNDLVIQRRVVQKLETLGEETGALTPPSDSELEQYLLDHAERYATSPILDLRQVMFDPLGHDGDLEADIDAAMIALQAGADPQEIGDSTMLPTEANGVALVRLSRDFGQIFADSVAELPIGDWQGPVQSGYGLHLVYVSQRSDAKAARLDEVRAAVERDWESDRRDASSKAFYQNLLGNYEVRVESITQ